MALTREDETDLACAVERLPFVEAVYAIELAVEPDPFPSPPRPRLLVIDDDPTTEAALASLDGIDTELESDGCSAIDRLTNDALRARSDACCRAHSIRRPCSRSWGEREARIDESRHSVA